MEAKGVEYRYRDGDIPALKNIDLSIEAGEYVAIIGANGSGKSTLAKLLNVLLVPTAGEIYIDGLKTAHQEKRWKIRQKVGMVFQNPDNQLVATSVEDDIAFGPENLGIPSPEIRERVSRSLEIVGMTGYEKHSPHNLSGGQKQRVAIAGILAMEPTCIVLDEPTAMLDPRGRKEVVDTIANLNCKKEITVVYITHYMEEACQANRIMVMDDGKIIISGSPQEVFSNSERLREVNLEAPTVVELAASLREEGFSIPAVMSVEGLVDFLC
ncbi:MAG: energy-coupling factor transporter ATPase [Halanaerobiales bacterium]